MKIRVAYAPSLKSKSLNDWESSNVPNMLCYLFENYVKSFHGDIPAIGL